MIPRSGIPLFLARYPGVLALSAICSGSLLFLWDPEIAFSTLVFSTIPFLLAVWFLAGTRRTLCNCVPFLLLTLFCVFCRLSPPDVRGERFGCEIEVRLDDPSLTGGMPDFLPVAPKTILGTVERFRYTASDSWHSVREPWFIALPSGNSIPLGYGDLVRMRGGCFAIRPSEVPGGFDYATYARVRGVSRRFEASECVLIRKGSSFLRGIYDLRGMFLTRLEKNISSDSSKGLAAGLLFGLRQGIPASVQSDFLYSGTIHILSVSGLHVGLFFGILLLFFRVIPYRPRWLLILIPVFLYALSTGLQAPAFRSFTMLAVWCLLRISLRRTAPVNALMLAAILLLLWNPLYLLDIGFQFSFLCVFFLLVSEGFIQDVRLALSSNLAFLPKPMIRRRGRALWRRVLLYSLPALILSSVVAYLASSVISLHHAGLFSPAAVPAFFLMGPLAWLCFCLFVFSLLFFWVPGMIPLCGCLMSPLLDAMRMIAEWMAEDTFFFSVPIAGWVALIFLLLFFLFLLIRIPRVQILCGTLMVLILTVAMLQPLFLPDELIVLSGGGGRPMILLLSPKNSYALVVNAPNYEAVRGAVACLRSRGIREIQELFLESPRRESANCARSLQLQIPVRSLRYGGVLRKNARSANRAVDTARESGYTELNPDTGIFTYERMAETGASCFRWREFALHVEDSLSGDVTVRVRNRSAHLKTFRLSPSPDCRIQSITLP